MSLRTSTNENFIAEWSASRVKLIKALAALQYELPALARTHTATIRIREDKGGGEYQYKYADLTDTYDMLRPLLKKHGLLCVQLTEPFNDAGDTVISTHVFHVESGECFVSYLCIGHNVSAQDEGGKLSYFRRYALQCVFGISTEDPDADLEAQAMSALQRTRDKFHPLLVDAIATDQDKEVKRVVDQMDSWQYNVVWKELNNKQKTTCREMLYRARSEAGGNPIEPLSEKDARRVQVRAHKKAGHKKVAKKKATRKKDAR